MTSLNPFRCDRCDSLNYEPENSKYVWSFSEHIKQDLCSCCHTIMEDYFFFGYLTNNTLSYEGIMKNENKLIKENRDYDKNNEDT